MSKRHTSFRRRLFIGLFAPLASLCLNTTAEAQEQPDTSEKFYYKVQYGKLRVANVSLFTGCTNTKTKPAAMMAISRGLAEQIHSFSIRFDTMLKPRQTQPLLGITSITEKGKTRVYRSRFKGKTQSKIAVTSRYKGQFKKQTLDLPHTAHDMLSWILDLRQKQNLNTNAKHIYYVWDGWKLFKLDATVVKRESIATPAGAYSTHRIELKRTRLFHQGEKKLTPKRKPENLGIIWLSTDKRKMPVAIDFYAKVGKASVRLTKQSQKNCKTTPSQ